MKRFSIVSIVLILGLCLAAGVWAADRGAIKAKVDGVVSGINGGKTATDFSSAASDKPYYVFIMKSNGVLVVHPSLTGKDLNEGATKVLYDELVKATDDGIWIQYNWKGKVKNTYVRKAKGDLIVGSGY
ncbi:MAG: hypothetical protein U9Q84_08550 [Thermodesulfobacteriota bacterium]|nr:hypothetical protein [Thermodesulfobacteriota bacterium]